jgi:UDP-N-acetylglucosamine 2-epimerase (non-hydrolysing)
VVKRVAIVIGTRPEAIKLAPVIDALRSQAGLEVEVIATGQHRDMLDTIFADLDLRPDVHLDLMRPGQSLSSFAGRCLEALGETFTAMRPDYVVGQGDTSSVLAAAHAAYLALIPFGHVEAGLRSGRADTPFPEEKNRTLVAQLSRHHFCPTPRARANLLREGFAPETIHVTGNPVIDTLLKLAPAQRPPTETETILVTVHRRENHAALADILTAIHRLLSERPRLRILWPVHRNPDVATLVRATLDGTERVQLMEPLSYSAFVAAMAESALILTDSGGVQEEAPALGKPVLVLRRETERPEGVVAGVARLVGTVRELLDDPLAYAAMARGASPYGDGRASGRIARVIAAHLLPLSSAVGEA